VNTRGFLQVGGTRSLQHFASEIARDVKDPSTGASVLERASAAERVAAYDAGRAPAEADGDLHVHALGSGSDYTPFLQHLGVSSVDVAFGGEASYGVYHSAYDSFDHFRRFVDPGFAYGVALAQVAGRMMLRAAQADVLPAKTADFADSIAAYTEELHKLSDDSRTKTHDLTALLDDGVFALATDPLQSRAAPQREAAVPYLQLSILDNAVAQLKISAKAFDLAYAQAVAATDAKAAARRDKINAVLTRLEETLTDSRGLPTRDWYQHMIYAPGLKTGYGAKTLPGIREAIEERRWDEANRYIGVVAAALDVYRATLDRVIAEP
jgi:N-acetylated-alpha-linked acidic dipeptidase